MREIYLILQSENPIRKRIPVLKSMAWPSSFLLSLFRKDKPTISSTIKVKPIKRKPIIAGPSESLPPDVKAGIKKIINRTMFEARMIKRYLTNWFML
jgi:hypothetical protein